MRDPLVVDLGYGATPHTTLELADRLASVQPGLRVIGIEIDPERVAGAQASATDRVSFIRGGFEIPLPHNRTADVIRAFNVLRQYDEVDVPAAWTAMLAAIQPDGLLVEGTCDEIGRVSTWIALTPGASGGPQSLTISLRLDGLEHPSIAAERLPKALIHHNVAGDPVNKLMTDLDRWWAVHAGLSAFGATQRWMATVESLKNSEWPVLAGRTRWRLGEVTIAWDALGRA
jgi:hypothetical protein